MAAKAEHRKARERRDDLSRPAPLPRGEARPISPLMARARRSRSPRPEPEEAPRQDPLCALCFRPIPPGVPQSLHHLIPKLKGGRGGPTVLLHHLCGVR